MAARGFFLARKKEKPEKNKPQGYFKTKKICGSCKTFNCSKKCKGNCDRKTGNQHYKHSGLKHYKKTHNL